ncbi:MAG TPA: hypothetical protein EYP80_02705 [Candidatus Aenigmarchaeota archaeon]|nr:hypothetical protein [Candidatus Aenigmarchaeota archaeon]
MYDIELGTIISISVSLLILGISLTVFPYLLSRIWGKDEDYLVTVMVSVFILILVIASQSVIFAQHHPDSLYPFVVITLGFRVISPAIFAHSIQEKWREKSYWKPIRHLLLLIALILIFYTFVSGMSNKTNENIAVSEKFIMTIAVTYTYARAYLKVVKHFLYHWEERSIFVSGFLIGISFVILIPFLLPEFSRVYKLSGTIGWLGAYLILYTGRGLRELFTGKPLGGSSPAKTENSKA